jgi:hypothetical protein
MAERLVGLGTALAVSAVLAGCSSAGEPPASSTRVPTSTEATGRSRTIDLTNVDPCTAFGPEQRGRLRIDKAPTPGYNTVLRAQSCGFPSVKSPRYGYTVSMVTTSGARTWLTEPDTTAVGTEVSGFPAVTFYFGHPLTNYGCQVAVDTAAGRHMIVGADVPVTSTAPRPAMDVMCQDAKAAAELALATLLGK